MLMRLEKVHHKIFCICLVPETLTQNEKDVVGISIISIIISIPQNI